MTSPSKQAAISAYRNLLKTQRTVFGEDVKAFNAAKKETYTRFMQSKDETNTDVLEKKLKMADQVATLLKQNVLQGVSKGDNTFKLRITKDTVLGDNDSIKNSKNSKRKTKRGRAAAATDAGDHSACCGHSH